MYKIMLVEDDNNLRAIYGDRLKAEGYEIVSAQDGEEALAIAVKEKPDVIISDVMMPKISGFDMLDILRSTPETMDVKVIMMTALSQAEDQARADKLGADKYLVKSQVTLEDVARVVHEVLGDAPVVAEPTAVIASPDQPAPATAIASLPVQPLAAPVMPPTTDTPINAPDQAVQALAATPTPVMQANPFVAPTPAPMTDPMTTQTMPVPAPAVAQPLQTMPVQPAMQPTPAPQPQIYDLYDKEVAPEQPVPNPIASPPAPSNDAPIAQPPTTGTPTL